MTFTYVAAGSGNNSSDSSGSSITITGLNVSSGLLVCWAKHEGNSSQTITMSSSADGAADGYTTQNNHSSANLSGRFGYWTNHSANASVTITISFSGTVPYIRVGAMNYTHAGTIALDQSNGGEGSSTTLSSGNITTTGTEEIVFGGSGEYTVANWSTGYPDINSLDYDQIQKPISSLHTALWSKRFTSTFTGAASGTVASSGGWVCDVVSFKETGGATGSQINIGDSWKEIAGVQINIGDAWKTVSGMQINIGDAWKTITI